MNGDTWHMCTRCFAVTGFSPAGNGGFDNSTGHAEWHRKQDELLKAHDDTIKAIAEASTELANLVADANDVDLGKLMADAQAAVVTPPSS